MTALFEVSASDVADTSDDWYTPPWLFEAAGLVFDIDVAAPVDPARRTCPARAYLTPVEDGLTSEWGGSSGATRRTPVRLRGLPSSPPTRSA